VLFVASNPKFSFRLIFYNNSTPLGLGRMMRKCKKQKRKVLFVASNPKFSFS